MILKQIHRHKPVPVTRKGPNVRYPKSVFIKILLETLLQAL